MNNELFAEAITLATEKHKLQTRRDGSPYIYHPLQVANIVKSAGYGIKYQIVAVLHDVLEDTETSEEEIKYFGDDILNSVKLLTRMEGAGEAEYVENILNDNMASVVKNADKIHNITESVHIGLPGEKRKEKDILFATRYIKKAKIYYYNKFSPALDSVILNAEAELIKPDVQVEKLWYSTPELKLFDKKENNDEKISENKLQSIYNNIVEFPDFNDKNIIFASLCEFGTTEYFCYISEKNIWKLTKAGWLPTQKNLLSAWDDVFTMSREEIIKIIQEKCKSNYFYDFVDKLRL